MLAVEVEQIRRHPISLGKEQKCPNIIHSFFHHLCFSGLSLYTEFVLLFE